jgi:DNA-binding NarL/FixJ family response regulator
MSDRPSVIGVVGPRGYARDLIEAVLSHYQASVVVPVNGSSEDATVGCAVLVEPGVEDWEVGRSLGVPIVLVMPRPDDDVAVVDAIRLGADAIVGYEESGVELMATIAAVVAGDTRLTPRQVRLLAERSRSDVLPARDIRLTARETQILDSIRRGESVKQTARELGISGKTVENLQHRMFRKLGVHSRAHALARAYQLSLLGPIPIARVEEVQWN